MGRSFHRWVETHLLVQRHSVSPNLGDTRNLFLGWGGKRSLGTPPNTQSVIDDRSRKAKSCRPLCDVEAFSEVFESDVVALVVLLGSYRDPTTVSF